MTANRWEFVEGPRTNDEGMEYPKFTERRRLARRSILVRTPVLGFVEAGVGDGV